MNRRIGSKELPFGLLQVLFVLLIFAGNAEASHFRYGHLTWEPRKDISETTVDFTLIAAFRRGGYSGTAEDKRPQLGDVIREGIGDTRLLFGDGTSTGMLDFEVIAYNVQEDWVIGVAQEQGGPRKVIRKTYNAPRKADGTPWIAKIDTCCRIGALINYSGQYRVQTQVDLSLDNRPPLSNLPPIVTCARGRTCTFQVPATDADGDQLRWRLSTSSESGISRLPGPPWSATSLTINEFTGAVSWITEPTTHLGLYSVAVTIEDWSWQGTLKSSAAIEFILHLAEFTDNEPPVFAVPPTPAPGSTLMVPAGRALGFQVQASDPDRDDTVFLNHAGLLSGAEFSAEPSNPAIGTFSWFPGLEDLGEHIVTFTATDNHGLSALPHPIKIQVIDPQIRNVSVIGSVNANGNKLDISSFAKAPYRIEHDDGIAIIEWRFDTFSADQVEDLDFDVILKDPVGGERRPVIYSLELIYEDYNGDEIRRELDTLYVNVLPSIYRLDVGTDKSVYSANESVIVTTDIVNLSAFHSEVMVRLFVKDPEGTLVSEMGVFQGIELGAGAEKRLTGLDFHTDTSYEGTYEVQAELLNSEGKPLFLTAVASFTIVSPEGTGVVAIITTDKSEYLPLDTVLIHDRIRNTSPNALLDGHSIVTAMYRPDGTLLWTQSEALRQLSPKHLMDLFYSVPLGRASPGTYRLTLAVHNAAGIERALSETKIQVFSTTETGFGLTGEITVTPNPVLKAETLHLRAVAKNLGNASLQDLPLTLTIVDPQNERVLAEWSDWASEIAVDGLYLLEAQWKAMGPTGMTYVAVLSAETIGSTHVLANTAFRVGEKLEITPETTGRGRLLALLDDEGQSGRSCAGITKLHMEAGLEPALDVYGQIVVEVYDKQGNLIDTETATLGDHANLINWNQGVGADLVIIGLTPDLLEISLSVNDHTNKLETDYRFTATLNSGGTITRLDSGLIPTSCSQPLKAGDVHGDFEVVHVDTLSSNNPSDRDPHGPKDAPGLSAQWALLEALLKREGWSYTIVTEKDAFARQLRSGGYSTYLLASEHVRLDTQVQQELREAVYRGEGLVIAGSHDLRNRHLVEALGVAVRGKHPFIGNIRFVESPLHKANTAIFSFQEQALRLDLTGAETAAVYITDQGRIVDHGHAVTLHGYGYGHTVYVGFDLLAQATASGIDSTFATLLARALDHVHPEIVIAMPGAVLPVTWTLTNHGSATTGRVLVTLFEGKVADPGNGSLVSHMAIVRPFSLMTAQSDTLRFWWQLPSHSGWASADLLSQLKDGLAYQSYGNETLNVHIQPVPSLADIRLFMEALASGHGHYEVALRELSKAEKHYSAGKTAKTLSRLVQLANRLSDIDAPEAREIRVQVAWLIRALAQEL